VSALEKLVCYSEEKRASFTGPSIVLFKAVFRSNGLMNYQIKVLRGLDRGDYVIVLARGAVDITGFEQILNKVIDESGPLLNCKVLVDFQDSIFRFLPSDITEFLLTFDLKRWPSSNKIAFICSPDGEQYRDLVLLGEGLVKMKFEVGVFYEMREAIDWLSGTRQRIIS
jgi:hypothetical protein